MNKIIVILSFAFGMLISSQEAISMDNVLDSIGVKTIDGKKFIIHKVEPKETLYALSRRYQVTLDDILTSNEEVMDGYAIDQIGRILFIPLKMSAQGQKIAKPANIHVVKSGETLYSLARQYEVEVQELKKWNELSSNQLSLGQELYVSAPQQSKEVVTKQQQEPSSNSSTTIIHTVIAGESIYRIAKNYDVKQDDIKKWNNLSSNEISIGQELTIKTLTVAAAKESTNTATEKVKEQKRYYIAKKGETYADVADMFNIFLPDLEVWNAFKEPFTGGEVIKIVAPDDKTVAVKSDQKKGAIMPDSLQKKGVHIVQSGETIYSLSDQYQVDMEDLRKWNKLSNYQLSKGQRLYVKNPDSFKVEDTYVQEVDREKEKTPVVDIVKAADKRPVQDTKAYFTVDEEDIPKIEKVVEKGVAEVIAGSDNTEKYLAMHRTAKIGTIMQVRNDLNDQIVFVRVLGKLPNTGVDEKVIIRISKKAFQKLGGVDYKFPVEISYLPLDD